MPRRIVPLPPPSVTTTGALVIWYICLGGVFVGMLLISKKIRNDGNTVRAKRGVGGGRGLGMGWGTLL